MQQVMWPEVLLDLKRCFSVSLLFCPQDAEVQLCKGPHVPALLHETALSPSGLSLV